MSVFPAGSFPGWAGFLQHPFSLELLACALFLPLGFLLLYVFLPALKIGPKKT